MNLEAAKIMVSGSDAGTYGVVTFEEPKLTGDAASNYSLEIPPEGLTLSEDIEIQQAKAPETPKLEGEYTSNEDKTSFVYTLKLTNPDELGDYRYRMVDENGEGEWLEATEPNTFVFTDICHVGD